MATAKKRVLETMATDTNGDTIYYDFDYNPAAAVEVNIILADNLSTLMSAINALTTNTYVDTYVTDTFSLNELKTPS